MAETQAISTLWGITVPGAVLALFYFMWKAQLAAWKKVSEAQLQGWKEATEKQLAEQRREFDRLWEQHDRAIEALEMHAAQMVRVNDNLENIKHSLNTHHNQTVKGGHL